MPSHKQTAQLAEVFNQDYPDELPARLHWLADRLRIDRPCLLRLLGLKPDEVEQNLGLTWKAIAGQWEDQAWWVEQLLSQLIELFHYDWQTLADRLHQPAEPALQANGKRVCWPADQVKHLVCVPQRDREETLLTLIAQGGPDVLLWLLEYFARATADPKPSPKQP